MTSLKNWLVIPQKPLKAACLAQARELINSGESIAPVKAAILSGKANPRDRGAYLLFRLFELEPQRLEEIREFILSELPLLPARHPRWAFARIAPFLVWELDEALEVYDWLKSNLYDSSKVMQILCLEGMWELTSWLPKERAGLLPLIKQAAIKGSPGVQVRARWLLAKAGVGF
ncbi:MAG: hypothetical protein A2527_13065 [Candidatus Lambdaproteobacteria bacterium RIFOXYD2_FULL_50_16]|uniref:DNA alkylation repair protein n=1 Tax=Candidatus Lambdaproteobacteria bacterium RIFOXYD2_FULL_50_16 TaxID=1817772 RepID=A0A1F6GG39_9PROT|nr:MAG: hypothetical protein A2527_13065 [Candidatus Lambdaproteobacteria bacterium RIFOXYD2_FULL_50_16]